MKEKLIFIEFMFKDLMENFKIHVGFKEIYEEEKKKHMKGELSYWPYNSNFMNKNHGKVALKRKITFLRQELLNLEKMLEDTET